MGRKEDRRIRKTKKQLYLGLASLLQKKSLGRITVRELVTEAGINRSTFYLHYSDVQNLLEDMAGTMIGEMKLAVECMDLIPNVEADNVTERFYIEMFRVMNQNREIAKALFSPNGDLNFISQVEELLTDHSKELLSVSDSRAEDGRYAGIFCMTGCLGFAREWLSDDKHISPENAGRRAYRMVADAMKALAVKELV